MENKNILEVKNIHKTFRNGKYSIHASNDVSFDIPKGKVVGLIGESGSGKTTIGRIIMNLIYPDSGSIKINETELAEKKLSKTQKKVLYRNIQMIFQDPYSSLNTQKNIMNIVAESLKAKKIDQELFDEFFKERDKIIFFSKYSLRNFFFEEYWNFKLFKNKLYIKEWEKIVNELDNFHVDKDKTIHKNIKNLYMNIIEYKEAVHYKVISKLNDFLNLIYKKWLSEKDKVVTKNYVAKDEKDLHEIQDKLASIESEIIESSETKKNKKSLKNLKFELKEIILENRFFISTVKKQYRNVKKNLKNKSTNLFFDKLETKDQSSYKNYDFLILKPKAKIRIINSLRNKRIFIDLNKVLNNVELEHSKLLENNDIKLNEKNASFKFKVDEIIESFKNKKYSSAKVKFDNLVLNKKEEIKKVEEELSKSIENDKLRDLGKLKAEKNEILKRQKKAQEIFDRELKKYIDKTELKFIELNKKNEEEMKILDNKLDKLKNKIKLKEKYIFKEIMSLKRFDSSIYKSLKLEKKAGKDEYLKYSKLTKTLLLEINSNTKIVNSLKFLYGISKSLFPHFSRKNIKEIIVRNKVFETLEKVGLNRSAAYRYPHEFSGGMRQRVGIARAIISKPKLIIADEPIAALDLSIQAQIVNLLMDLKKSEDLSILFIAHDLSMVEHNSDEVIIMHLGRIVEKGDSKEIFKNPIHPYTKTLMNSIPTISKINNKFKDIKFVPNYLKNYSILSKPEFHQISRKHFVFGTEEQIKKWK